MGSEESKGASPPGGSSRYMTIRQPLLASRTALPSTLLLKPAKAPVKRLSWPLLRGHCLQKSLALPRSVLIKTEIAELFFFLYSLSEEVSWNMVQQWWARTHLILFHFQKARYLVFVPYQEGFTVGQKIVLLTYPLHCCLPYLEVHLQSRERNTQASLF